MGFNDKFALQKIWLFSNSRRARWLCRRRLLLAPSGRQRSDFMSFQTSIISFVLPCR
jgi:hypothetical protein